MEDLFDFTDWLRGVETPAEGVTVYQKPGLIGQLQKAKEAVAALGENPERSIGDYNPQSEVDRLQLEIARSKTVWYISPLSRDVEKAIAEAYPEPEPPVTFTEAPPRLADRATVQQSEAFMAAWAAYQKTQNIFEIEHQKELTEWREKVAEVIVARGSERIARAVSYIDTYDEHGKVTRRSVNLTGQQIREMEHALGTAQLSVIAEALKRISDTVLEPDPFESPTS